MDTVENLYNQSFTEIHRWFRREVGNTDDAADLAQDTFLRLSLREHEGAPIKKGLMWKVAKDLLTDWRRKQSRAPQFSSLDELDTGQSEVIKIARTPRDS